MPVSFFHNHLVYRQKINPSKCLTYIDTEGEGIMAEKDLIIKSEGVKATACNTEGN
ncbi:MAG: hypothetical protein ACE5IH_10810 [Thermodesulfobacteriota bacterium]